MTSQLLCAGPVSLARRARRALSVGLCRLRARVLHGRGLFATAARAQARPSQPLSTRTRHLGNCDLSLCRNRILYFHIGLGNGYYLDVWRTRCAPAGTRHQDMDGDPPVGDLRLLPLRARHPSTAEQSPQVGCNRRLYPRPRQPLWRAP